MVVDMGIYDKCWRCGRLLERHETHLRNHDVLVCSKCGEVGMTWWDSFTKLWYSEWQ